MAMWQLFQRNLFHIIFKHIFIQCNPVVSYHKSLVVSESAKIQLRVLTILPINNWIHLRSWVNLICINIQSHDVLFSGNTPEEGFDSAFLEHPDPVRLEDPLLFLSAECVSLVKTAWEASSPHYWSLPRCSVRFRSRHWLGLLKKYMHRLVLKSLLYCVDCVFWIIVVFEWWAFTPDRDPECQCTHGNGWSWK